MAFRTALENLVAVCRAGNVAIHGGDGEIKRFTKALEDAESALVECKTMPCPTLPDDIEWPLETVPDVTMLFGGSDD